ncbi:hypothetical protein KKI23_01035 [Patescibacteria group bacterium]|nr:hypothetical protein [Patescibacteria group bacterium]
MSKKVPETLGEVMGQNLSGWKITFGYYLELVHGLMNFLPAIISETKQMVICLDEELLGRVHQLLPARPHKQGEMIILLNEDEGVCFHVANERGTETWAGHILTAEEFDRLTEGNAKPFRWA